MKINADLGQRAVVYSEELPWVASPLPGVDRRMLERDGEEVARATSVVRYAPDSSFDAHVHGGGEEFLVLEGVFSDEHGDFGPGMYVRNPPGSRHTPRSGPGCTILVKLRQMDPDDQDYVRIDTTAAPWQPGPVEGASVMPLFERGSEKVALWRLAPGTRLARHEHPGRRGDVRARRRARGRARPLSQGRLAAQPARQRAPAVQPGRLPAVRQDRPPRRLARYRAGSTAGPADRERQRVAWRRTGSCVTRYCYGPLRRLQHLLHRAGAIGSNGAGQRPAADFTPGG